MRGSVLRSQCDDLKHRIDRLDASAKSVCFGFIRSTFQQMSDGYALASSADRTRILNEVRQISRNLWEAGNRPQALALGVIMLNLESRLEMGEDADFVKAATDALIRLASI